MKRALDIFISLSVLTLAWPFLAVLALLVRLRMGHPVLFRQERPGLSGKVFLLYKLRTMNDLRGPDGELLSDAERLTPLGAWIRNRSLDELPQLINVLRGDMSLVGPRPLLKKYLPLYSPEQARRHEVKPGMTGWAQVNGRNALSWEDKFALDVWYVEHRTFWLDLKVLFLTALRVVKRNGIRATGEATMPEFTGISRR